MSAPCFDIQRDWDSAGLEGWPTSFDTRFLLGRIAELAVEITAEGASGPVLEVAAAEALHACRLSHRGLETFVVEPSWAMLARAAAHRAELGARITLVRGIAETLPFHDATFDRILIDSAIDHLASPDAGIREMTRVLKPDGRLVISFVNYGGLAARAARLFYRWARRVGLARRDVRMAWDTPVPIEHSFECTLGVLRRVCEQYLELDRAVGVSLGWGLPGWANVVDHRLSEHRARQVVERLDRLACHVPALADYVFTVWRPRPRPVARPRDETRVRAVDPAYQWKIRAEAEHWTRFFNPGLHGVFRAAERLDDARYTGSPDRSWLDDLAARGPFGTAAVLGCDAGGYEAAWWGRGSSEELDVYDLTPAVLRRVRAGMTDRGRVRFIQADLNFVQLPAARYDVIWSSGCLHHVVNLESLFAEVERALRDGGLFAIHDYVGERRMQFAPERLARINALLRDLPPRYRCGGTADVTGPPPFLSPFCAVRSDEILEVARARFDVVHEGRAGALFPLFLLLDLPALEREEPALLGRLLRAEEEALADPRLRACGAYAVLRKRC